MEKVTVAIALLALLQGSLRAEPPWRFIQLTDWHAAESYVQPERYPGVVEQNDADLKMLKDNYGGELILMPGDACTGHWDTPAFMKSFNPTLTPAEAIRQAGERCYAGMEIKLPAELGREEIAYAFKVEVKGSLDMDAQR